MDQLTTAKLETLAQQILIEEDFLTEMPPEILKAPPETDENKILPMLSLFVRDQRALLWTSIDNASSRDLDQVEFAQTLPDGGIRLLVGIADVDAFVPQDSAIDRFAARNTTSVYAGSLVFPMLPERLSTDLTSLNAGFDRLAIITEMIISPDGNVKTIDVYRALIHNYAKLTYEEIGAWLEGKSEMPETVANVEGLEEQIRVQEKAASSLQRLRKQNGALEFESIESMPVISGGIFTGIDIVRSNAARKIIENFMIAANVAMAEFLEKRNVASLRRIVKTPERWNRIVDIVEDFGENLPAAPDSKALADFLARQKASDPLHYPDLSLSIIKLIGSGDYIVDQAGAESEGHFGLAVRDYTHSTAPNRRYADLILQRLVKATLARKPSPYSAEELEAIAERCNKRESAAKKVERKIRKIVAASVMAPRVGETFEAIVTGRTPGGTFARILLPPVDGRIVKGEENLQVGDKIRVRLQAVNPENGFIDFGRDEG